MARLVVLQIATRTAAEIAGARLAHLVLSQQLVRSSSCPSPSRRGDSETVRYRIIALCL